jgi:hypothetical protein
MAISAIASNYSASHMSDVAERRLVKKHFMWVLRVGVLGLVALGFWYLLLLNALATKGFELSELKNDRVRIQKELEKWDIALTIPASLYALGSSEQVQEMVDVDKKIYVEVRGDDSVAMAY